MGKKHEVVIDLDADSRNQNWLRVVRKNREKVQMTRRKEERNRRFWRDWKEKGLSNKELSLKYGLSLESVKSFKKVLKLRYEK
ncbi:MAG: hypothetical protein ACE5K3_00980 [bacterium]